MASEAEHRCRRAEEGPLPDLAVLVLQRDRIRVTEGRVGKGGECHSRDQLHGSGEQFVN